MTKLQLPSFSLPKFVNKTFLLVSAGVVVFLGITVYGIVRESQYQSVQKAEQAKVQADAASAVKANTQRLKSLQGQVTAEQTENAQLCSWIKAMAADKSKKLTVPPLCASTI
jgi:transcriptional regulator GlxA family with amidase domain